MAAPLDRKGEGASAPFHLILAEAEDVTALRLCRVLRRVARAEFVTPEEAFMASRWSHDPFGESRVELASGLVLEDATVLSVFNRVRHVSPLQFAASAAADQVYASEEFFALIVSWLTGFGARCVNRPHPGSVAGYAARSVAEDRLRLGADLHASSRARHLGLGRRIVGFPDEASGVSPGGPGRVMDDAGARRVLVAGEAMSEGLPAPLRQPLRAEMARRRLTVAEARLVDAGAGWRLAALDPLPEAENEAEIALIADHLLQVAQPERGAA